MIIKRRKGGKRTRECRRGKREIKEDKESCANLKQ